MSAFCVDVGAADDKTLEFFGFYKVEESDEFKIYMDKYGEDHIVAKAKPLLYVPDLNDAKYLASGRIVQLDSD